MSRIAKSPVTIPSGVDVKVDGQLITVKGSNGVLERDVHASVTVVLENNEIKFGNKNSGTTLAMAGTMRNLVKNMVEGVSKGFEKKLQLVGVGYRAKVEGKDLNLTLGFSHPVLYPIPAGISIETPTNTEVVVKGMDKQLVGQVSADIRAYRPPEPYKGKGVRYSDENVRRKDAKKK